MNERIQELASKIWYREHLDVHEVNIQMFAELIIRECAKQVKDFYSETEFTCYGAESEILSHFGLDN